MPAQEVMAPTRSSSTTRTPRGSACLNCRRRKLRCDSARPVCGPCVRAHRECDCEYTDGPTRSRTQVLEEEIAILEARIHELEHPGAPPVTVSLHEPRNGSPATLSLSSHSSSSSASPPHSAVQPKADSGLCSAFGHFSPSPPNSGSWDLTDPPLQVVQLLVNYFLPHASQFGFFLHQPRFLQSVCIEDSAVRIAKLSPALLNAVYLWGVRLSGHESLYAHEPIFVTRAVHALSTVFARAPAYNPIYTLQAEVLLASYFFHSRRFLEARQHCSAAAALALSCRLNTIRSASDPQLRTPLVDIFEHVLPPTSDSLEEGERINAFWTVYILDKSWAVALDTPSYISTNSGTHIDTPWPLDMEDYESASYPPVFQGFQTVQSFLTELPIMTIDGTSMLALRSKAAALFEHAAGLAARYEPTMANVDSFFTEFFVLDSIIDSFTASLPAIDGAANWLAARDLLIVHTYARAATIQLYSNFRDAEGLEGCKDLSAAKAAIVLLDGISLSEITFLDPIMAILWTAISRVLIREIARLRISRASAPDVKDEHADGEWIQYPEDAGQQHWLRYTEAEELQFVAGLQKIVGAMTTFSQSSELMRLQLATVQQEIDEAS
ncbi:hypothetical protein B0H21DRAFT_725428 [Amylocystis lapponica]|nr:hypothetical protein B0H21DRAFT_725428 [Amylocystis lapponica]